MINRILGFSLLLFMGLYTPVAKGGPQPQAASIKLAQYAPLCRLNVFNHRNEPINVTANGYAQGLVAPQGYGYNNIVAGYQMPVSAQGTITGQVVAIVIDCPPNGSYAMHVF
jgi:hypothetical protein